MGVKKKINVQAVISSKMNVLQTYYGNHFSDVTKITDFNYKTRFFVAKYINFARFKVSFFDDEDIRDSNLCILGQWQ